MRIKFEVLVLFGILYFCCGAVWRETTFIDFSDGDTTHVKILRPDPDGMDDGALWLPPGRDTIFVLQVYPDGHCLNCVSSAIYNYMRSGSPPLNIKIYLIPISDFNAQAVGASSLLTVRYIDASGSLQPPETKALDFFDVLIFGVADCYGGAVDLNATSRDAVLSFGRLGKGLILTHDTGTSQCSGHPNFCSLTELTGLSCYPAYSSVSYTSVSRVYDPPGTSILHAPFDIPPSFSVLLCHWSQQRIENGWVLYVGNATPTNPYDNLLYWHSYHNPTYNSFSSFFNYGHTEAVPLEWESKAMINCIYYSYHGGIGSGVYTSSAFDPLCLALVNEVSFSADIPSGCSLKVEISIDTSHTGSGAWTSWARIPVSGYRNPFGTTLARRFRYRVGFARYASAPPSSTPILHWIQIDYDCCRAGSIDSVWFFEETACNDSNWVRICYSLSGCPSDIDILLSSDGGLSWNVPLRTTRDIEGDTGVAVLPGVHCFEWLASADFPSFETRNFAVGIRQRITNLLRRSTKNDFLGGDTSHVRILSPDPDGTDDGALWLPPSRDTIYVLQVYPDGHCLNCMSNPIYTYMASGTPPLNIKIYMKTITSFNAEATSATSPLIVQYITPAGVLQPAEVRSLDYFDVVIFGVADCYASYDLTPSSRNALLGFMRMGKGLILTHDTATNWPNCGNHVNFCSLTEVTGISCYDQSGWATYTTVSRFFDPPGVPVLHTPFEIPTTFSVLLCHWLRQRVENGWILYVGNASPGGPYDNLLYWHGYHNPTYNSFSSFFNYGHTEAVPLEWEAKAMINCIYYSYHGGIGSGVYTSPIERLVGEANLISINYSATVPVGASITVEFAVDTVIGSGEGWTSWMSSSSLPFSRPVDGIRYRVGFTRNLTGDSPIFHFIEFSFLSTTLTIQRGNLDTYPPRINLTCPDRFNGGDIANFRWHIEDLFLRSYEGFVDIFGCGIREHYSITDTSYSWTVPNVDCFSCTLVVTMRDSFCNWGRDTCTFAIIRSLPELTFRLTSDSLRCYPGGRILPKPFVVSAYVTNIGSGRADSVYIYLNITDCFRIVVGSNPMRVFDLIPGETDSVRWEIDFDRRCEGRNECVTARVISFP